jgi:hypothetical protein
LGQLDLEHTNDPETVTIAGAIEKKYFELGQGDEHLSNAIPVFQRGYYLLNNRYIASTWLICKIRAFIALHH